MPPVSKNNPFYFITSVTHNRLPAFRTDKLKKILCDAFNESRNSAGFSIFAYIVMADHFHIITDSKLNKSETLRYLNGISARRVIGYLKENSLEESLVKLRNETKDRGYKHSLWEYHSNSFEIKTEDVLMQKVNYIHQTRSKKVYASSRKIIAGRVSDFGKVLRWKMSH
jgi:REP element-mobilizing transposase RayT